MAFLLLLGVMGCSGGPDECTVALALQPASCLTGPYCSRLTLDLATSKELEVGVDSAQTPGCNKGHAGAPERLALRLSGFQVQVDLGQAGAVKVDPKLTAFWQAAAGATSSHRVKIITAALVKALASQVPASNKLLIMVSLHGTLPGGGVTDALAIPVDVCNGCLATP